MLNEFKKKLKLSKTLTTNKKKIEARNLVICKFYQGEEITSKILQKIEEKGKRKNNNGKNIERYKYIENNEEMQKITEYYDDVKMSTTFVGQNEMQYIRI